MNYGAARHTVLFQRRLSERDDMMEQAIDILIHRSVGQNGPTESQLRRASSGPVAKITSYCHQQTLYCIANLFEKQSRENGSDIHAKSTKTTTQNSKANITYERIDRIENTTVNWAGLSSRSSIPSKREHLVCPRHDHKIQC